MKNFYYKAAKLVADDIKCYACTAIDAVSKDRYSQQRDKFAQMFWEPESELYSEGVHRSSDMWFGNAGYEENQLARTLALLLMHEMEKENKK